MSDSDTIENLLPSLIQCFSVIFLGYLAVKLSIITPHATAIGTYVTKFALPALFFRSMATIDFTKVNWAFISAISLSKFILFSVTFICTILITRPINFGMAGILSMFITQSNDVALGYPILLSLYPDLAKYIYLFAPAQLVLINPLCFILLECNEYRSERKCLTNHVSHRRRIITVFQNVVLNPLVYMTVIGVIFNVILSHKLPIYLDKILQILADSFAGVSLFYLGMNMVGKIGRVTKKDIHLLLFLLIGKLIFLPFLNRELVVHLIHFETPSNQSLNYSLVAFLYGGLPTAPPVFLIASSFQVLPDLIATGLVLGTLLSGPLMFITARVITMVVISKSQFDSILRSTAVSVSVISLCGCVWVLVVFLLSRRYKNPINKMTLCYIFYVILSCSGAVIGRVFISETSNQTHPNSTWSHYFQFSIFFIGCVGTRLCIALIAAMLMIIKRRCICWLIRNFSYFFIVGMCIPIIVTLSLLFFSSRTAIADIDPSFQYGKAQLVTSLVILTSSILSIIVFLILQSRSDPKEEVTCHNYSKTIRPNDGSLNDENGVVLAEEESSISYRRLPGVCVNDNLDIEEHELEVGLLDSEYVSDDDTFQINRHLALTIILEVTMIFGWFLCLWRLIREDISGIYFELEFLDCVFNFGQGFILWVIFGLDTKLIIIPFKKKLLKLIPEFYTPLKIDLPNDVIRIKKQFVKYHLENCRRAIINDERNLLKLYSGVFYGKNIIDWIIEIGLANNRIDASIYGQALLTSKVIVHMMQSKILVDDEESMYRFNHDIDNDLISLINDDSRNNDNEPQNVG